MKFRDLTDNLKIILYLFVLSDSTAARNVQRTDDVVDVNELFHTNFRDVYNISYFWDRWYTCPSADDHQPALFYRYNRPYVLQNYTQTANLHVNSVENTLDISSQPNAIDRSWTGGAISLRDQFLLYGEYEWIARIAPSRNILSAFRLTDKYRHWDVRATTAIKTERLQSPAIQLTVEWMGAENLSSLTATVFYPSADDHVGQESPDWSDSPETGWTSSVTACKVCQTDLSRGFYSYKLRWTKKQLIWFVNDTVAFYLQDVRKIPQSALRLSISLVRGENIVTMTPANLSIQSVTVRSISEDDVATAVAYEQINETAMTNFSNLSDSRWRIWDGLASHSDSVRGVNPIYDRRCVREKNGILQLLVGQTTTSANERYYNTARIDSATAFLYGDIEWRVRVKNPSIGATYWLQLVQNPCTEATSVVQRYATFQCRSSIGPSIDFQFNRLDVGGFYYHFDNQGELVFYRAGQSEYQFQLSGRPRSISDFHRFRICWRNSSITWYIDDDEIGRITDASVLPNNSMFISMQTLVWNRTPNWPAAVMGNSAFLVPSMEIEYLKYTSDTTMPLMTTTSTISTTKSSLASITTSWQRATAITAAVFVIVVVMGCALFYRMRSGRPLRPGIIATNSVGVHVLPMLLRTIPSSQRHAYARYMQFMEVPRDTVDISSEVLGRGEFSVVLKGSARSLPTVLKGPTEVAVKTLSNSNDQTKFYEEFLIMIRTGRHANIVNLLGVVLEGDRQCLLLEFCRYGSLRSHLLSHGTANTNHHVDSHGSLLPCACIARKDAVKSDQQVEILETTLCTSDLLKFSHQISRGMEYLTSRAIIHRDLAARNVLVSANGILKISDFGLAKHGQQEYMVSNMSAALPVLWMPPEAILTGTFSRKSDVWSFGVVLWEIFSQGQSPFNAVDVSNFSSRTFAAWLLAGHHMEMPPGTPTDLRKVMKNCWKIKPEERPDFTDLVPILNDIIQSTSDGLTYILLLAKEDELPAPYKELLELETLALVTSLQTDA